MPIVITIDYYYYYYYHHHHHHHYHRYIYTYRQSVISSYKMLKIGFSHYQSDC
jgi:hypothetical protein